MDIKVLGWYNHGNTGDEAYKASFPLLFPSHNVEFVEEIKAGESPDVVILGGGDVFYPSFTRFFDDLPATTKKIAASISLTDNSDITALSKFDKVILRDKRSCSIAHKHGIDASYQPDFAFMMTPDGKAGREWLQSRFDTEGHQLYEKVVVCVVSNYLSNSKLTMLARDLTNFLYFSQNIAQIADEVNASFVFLSFSTKAPWDDRVSNSWVADRCKYYDKNLVVWEKLDVQTTLNIIAASNVCVSSRLHATIFSTISGVPFIDLTHHTKNLGFIETIDKTSWSMPYWQFSVSDFRKMLEEFLAHSLPNASLIDFSELAKGQLVAANIL